MQDTSSKKARSYYQSSSFKMAVLFTTLLGLSALFLGYFLYDFGKQNFIRETEAAIDAEIEQILIFANINEVNITHYISKKRHSSTIYRLVDNDGNFLAGNLPSIPSKITLIKEGVLAFTIKHKDNTQQIAAKVYTFTNGMRLLIGRDITKIIISYDRFKFFCMLIFIFMFIVICVSFFISMFVVSRINNIALTARRIMITEDLSRRITIDSKWDDLSYLAKTLNHLFDKLESLMQGIRDVSDNIAHDLKTPITRLRNDLESLKNEKPTPQTIAMLIGEADTILNIFNSLLRITNIEKGKRKQSFSSIKLDHILNDVIELYEPLADEKNIALTCELTSDMQLMGDNDLLFQLFANLLDNAIKFSPTNSSIFIGYTSLKKKFSVTIADNGMGVPHDEIEKIFTRFYRSDRSRNTAGSGLGLSLVKAIAELHKATITLEDNQPGLKINLTFPKN